MRVPRRCVSALTVILVHALCLSCRGDDELGMIQDMSIARADMSSLAADMMGDEGSPRDQSMPSVDAALDCDASVAGCAYSSKQLAIKVHDVDALMDPITSRELPLLVRAPAQPGTYPVVVWGHGGSLNNTGHRLGKTWSELIASQGYIVVHMAHVEFSNAQAITMCELSGLPNAQTCRDNLPQIYTVTRAHDMRALLVHLPTLMASLSQEHGLEADIAHLALAGWSAGSHAPSTLSGATRELAEQTFFSLRPPQGVTFDATIMLSPSGPGHNQYFAHEQSSSWETIRPPTLMATGAHDIKESSPDHTGELRRQSFDYLPADGSRYMLYSHIKQGTGGHGTYNLGDVESPDAALSSLSLALQSVVLAFLDAHLRDDPEARAFLQSTRPSEIAGDAEWLRK